MTRIRKAKAEDFSTVFSLIKELWPQIKFSRQTAHELYTRFLKSKNQIQLVMEEDETIIGYAAVHMRESFEEQGTVGYLSELIITEKQRGEGKGTSLLEETMKRAKQKGCKELQFPSTFKRERAHRFYEQLGFNKTSYFFWKEL